jgi:hypothetical protein
MAIILILLFLALSIKIVIIDNIKHIEIKKISLNKPTISKKERLFREAQKDTLDIISSKPYQQDKYFAIKQMAKYRLNTFCTIELKTSKTMVGYIVSCDNTSITLRLAFDDKNQMPYSTIFYDAILAIS